MCDRVVHRREFRNEEYYNDLTYVLEFDTAIDVFKVIHVQTFEGFPTVWYETLENPIHRRKVTLNLVHDDNHIPDNSMHVGSCLYGPDMLHVYQVF